MAAKRGKPSGGKSGGSKSGGDGPPGGGPTKGKWAKFDPEKKYEEFPPGRETGATPRRGYNEFVQLNDRSLFTAEAQANPVINAFLEAYEREQISITYVQLKSSTRESEWFLHKPHLALGPGRRPSGIAGGVARFSEGQPVGTYVINHDRTLAFRPMRALMIADGDQVGQMIHKGDPNYQDPEGDGS